MVHLKGLEPLTHGFEGHCSIQLSYRCQQKNGAGEGDRTLATGLEGRGSTTELHPHGIFIKNNTIISFFLMLSRVFFGGGEWIRTTESAANGFTVRPLWPLGNSSSVNMELAIGIEPTTC